jgi:hypothetical protein
MSVKYLTAFTGGTPIPGFKNVGKIAVDTNPGSGDYSLGNFVGGVSESYDTSGYVIITDTTTADVVGRPTGNNSGFISQSDQPTYWVSPTKDDAGFLYLVNKLPERSGQATFSSPLIAATWLRNNGYWTSYVTPVLSLDAGNPASYPGTGSVWTDIIGGKTFNLINGPGYESTNGGRIKFNSGLGHYAECSTSLTDLNTWSVGVWHRYDTTTGAAPCIVTEVFPGSTGQINYSLGNNNGGFSSGFFDGGGWKVINGYTLTQGNWYFIVGTYDGIDLKIYINNTLVDSTNHSGTPISSQGGIRLMRRWDLADYWGGYLSTVDIYDEALDSTKVTSIWNLTKSRFGL